MGWSMGNGRGAGPVAGPGRGGKWAKDGKPALVGWSVGKGREAGTGRGDRWGKGREVEKAPG